MNKRKIPFRTCCVTNEKIEKNMMFRVVRTPEGLIIVDDEKGKANGRGTYLKKDKDVILKAKKSKALDRQLKVKIEDNIYNELISLL